MSEEMAADHVSRALSSTTRFADLPYELRREIWHQHFNGYRHIHVICSANNSAYPSANPPVFPLHLSFDATTNTSLRPCGSDQPYHAGHAHSEARGAFLETNIVADLTSCGPGLAGFPPERLERYAHGKICVAAARDKRLNCAITAEQVKAKCEALLKKDAEAGRVRFSFNVNSDLVYLLDYQNGRMFSKLCGSPWMARVNHIALAVADGRWGPGMVWNHENMADEIRRHNELEGSAEAASFMAGKAGRFSTFSLVIIPGMAKRMNPSGAVNVPRDEFGFAALRDCVGILSKWEMAQAKEVINRVSAQILEAFPPGKHHYDIRGVVDVDSKQPVGDVTYRRHLRAPQAL